MTADPNAHGFLLLTLPDCHLTSPKSVQTGTLSLECVTIPVPTSSGTAVLHPTTGSDSPTDQQRDVWLVLRLNSFEMLISPTQVINRSRSNNTYTFPPGEGNNGDTVVIELPRPETPTLKEDQETFEVVLGQYGVVHHVDPDASGTDGDLKGRLVLVDEDNGQVLGTLGGEFNVVEDPSVRASGREKDPVIVELPDGSAAEGTQEIHVHPVRPEETDFLMRSAQVLSRGIVYATGAITSGMHSAANAYVRSATPSEKPIVFSDQTKAHVQRVHKFSGKAVKVTAKTTAMIHHAVDSLANRLMGSSSRPNTPAQPHRSAAYAPGVLPVPPAAMPPPLPPRDLKGNEPIPTSVPAPIPAPLPPYSSTPSLAPSHAATPPPLPPRKPRLLNRILLSTDLLLTTLENSAKELLTHGSESLSTALGHKYGKDVGDATLLVGHTARNVGAVYIDMRGVGRRALLKRAGKQVIKGTLSGGREVLFAPDPEKQVQATAEPPQPTQPIPQYQVGYTQYRSFNHHHNGNGGGAAPGGYPAPSEKKS